ncbi:prepilin-type N-terminal cleavage/methylation domain-containing protein [Patescibacteria group bacterium]|nr:prepilin-type N-terminal cleavage/methylation domain-containing protein [Patescibacteria group bacterium]
MFEHKKNEEGFTLVEMLVALTIFSVTMLVATDIYLTVSNAQQRTLAAQKIMGDVRTLFETITQEVRLGQINYDYYVQKGIDLHPSGSSGVSILALKNQINELIFFRKNVNKVQFCQEESADDCDPTTGSGWVDVTPEGVEIEDFKFVITPSADPFTDIGGQSCTGTCSGDYLSYRCDGVSCKYDTDGNNFQPKVKILLKSKSIAKRLAEQSQITMQTVVSSRVLRGEVVNDNY